LLDLIRKVKEAFVEKIFFPALVVLNLETALDKAGCHIYVAMSLSDQERKVLKACHPTYLCISSVCFIVPKGRGVT
jgi:hypothetical protein